MRFPLADWIDGHAGCRYDLASSGMRGSVPDPPWPERPPSPAVVDDLHEALAEHLGVEPARLAVAHGASEANGWVLGYLGHRLRSSTGPRAVRVRPPEYPPLVDAAPLYGLRPVLEGVRAPVALLSRPRNPEGDLWTDGELEEFVGGARHVLVDETFREFAAVPSLAARQDRRLWTTGSFTKFFGADAVRIGFAVAPPGEAREFARYVGIVSDEVAPASAAAAVALLRRIGAVRRAVRRVLEPNLAAFRKAYRGSAVPAAPLFFDRLGRASGRALARRCLRASVLVCPGDLFGETRGVRVTLTRRDFPRALAAYLRVRGPPAAGSAGKPRV